MLSDAVKVGPALGLHRDRAYRSLALQLLAYHMDLHEPTPLPTLALILLTAVF